MSQIDTENDKNLKMFKFSIILWFFSKCLKDFVDWNNEKGQQGKMCRPVGFSEDFIAVF